MIDRISDMITRIRNGYLASKETVSMPYTTVLENIAKVLVDEKYLSASSVETDEAGKKSLKLTLSYNGNSPALNMIKRISKPGVRIYTKANAIKPVLSGLGIAILSTPKGIISDRTARKEKVGGEILFELW